MGHPRRNDADRTACEIIDFDDALLDACPSERRSDLLIEARLLAGVFAPGGDPAVLTRMARQLSAGERDGEMQRAHARRLAAALKRLARDGL